MWILLFLAYGNFLRMADDIFFSIVIACYCEEPHLLKNIKILADYFSITKWRVEFILIDDASPDKTVREIAHCVEYLTKSGFAVQTKFHEVNVGRGGTVQEGFLAANGKYVGFIDIDLEHFHDALIPILLDFERDTHDAVVGLRVLDKREISWIRVSVRAIYRFLVKSILHPPVSDTEAGLKIFRRNQILDILPMILDKYWFWDTEICVRGAERGLRFKEHPIIFKQNFSKKSTVRVLRDSWRYLVCLIKYKMNSRRELANSAIAEQIL